MHAKQLKQGKALTPIRSWDKLACCTVEGCDRPTHSHEYCLEHSTRARKGKVIDAPIRQKINGATIEERFWAWIDRGAPDECWEWQGSRTRKGYGQFTFADTRRKIETHRLSWELNRGPIPPGLRVLHHCDNPPCCNPGHLFLGTQADNVRDMVLKGRSTAALTAPEVLLVREQLRAGARAVDLALEFGVSKHVIHGIKLGRTWKYL